MLIGILNHGVGNLGSVQNALSRLNYDFSLVNKPEDIDRPAILIIPGVSSFPALMQALRSKDFTEPLTARFGKGSAILGICSGMQILASEGDEFETTKGLNFIPGKVRKLRIASTELPQVGFNRVSFQGHLAKTEKDRDFYFLNSYGFFPEYEASVLGTYIYGEVAAAVIRRDHVMGIQFHPEKSHMAGVSFLGRAIEGLRNND